MSYRAALTLAALVAALAPARPAAAQSGRPLSGKEIYQRALQAVVWVTPFEEDGDGRTIRSSGSGSLIDGTGRYVLTNYHVVRDNPVVMVFFPSLKEGKPVAERSYYIKNWQSVAVDGKVIARDKSKDLAVIQIPAVPRGSRALKLAAEGAGPGDTVHSVGNPGVSGALWAYTPGSVKAVYEKTYRSRGSDGILEVSARVVETTSPVNPGDSGGPLLNDRGELVAVTQGGIFDVEARNISFFIDVSEVKGLLKRQKIRLSGAQPAPAAVSASAKPAAPEGDGDKPAGDAEKNEKAAAGKLVLAKDLLATPSKKQRGRERLEEIVKQFPATAAAAEARQLLKANP